jgi:DNA-binding response OmpR family regulator
MVFLYTERSGRVRGVHLRILIAEQEAALGIFVARTLEQDDHAVTVVADGDATAMAIASADYDLLLLSLDLSSRYLAQSSAGMEVLEIARQLGNGMRVLVLTSQAAEIETRVACLEAGADDCMAKPFAMVELKARCRALLRRQDGVATVLRCGPLELNRLEQSVARDQEPVALSRREFALLEYLMLHRGHCVSRATLLEQVWSSSDAANTNVVDVYVNYLRRKLGPSQSLIETIRGQGYRIAAAAVADRKLPVAGILAGIETGGQARHATSVA